MSPDIDLDRIEAAARKANGQSVDFSSADEAAAAWRAFVDIANPETVLALVARARRCDHLERLLSNALVEIDNLRADRGADHD